MKGEEMKGEKKSAALMLAHLISIAPERGRDPQWMISPHAGQRMNRRLLRLPLVTPWRMRKDSRRKEERMLGVRLLKSCRNAARVSLPMAISTSF
jgi:hypothetical protein